MKQYRLAELCGYVQEMLEDAFPDRYWVCAEIASMSVRNHCYMELVEKAENGILAAKLRATCWQGVYNMLSVYFEHETGQSLHAGMQVLLEVSVEFHAVYGMSLNIWNIDPTYTLGDLARQRQMTIEQLKKDGVMDLQRSLCMATLPRRVAVISSADAAGYGDFCHQLQSNRYGFTFMPHLFAATMQGETAARSIIHALAIIAEQEEEWDVVVIIRGGGATTDLSCFDDYALASHCAQFPIPIVAGIGHTRDVSVVDMVANTSVKTPTAAAEWLIERVAEQVEVVADLQVRLQRAVQTAIVAETNHILQYKQRILVAIDKMVMHEKSRFDLWQKTIELHSPEHIFSRGYSLTMVNGCLLRSAEQVQVGDVVETHLADGKIESVVQ